MIENKGSESASKGPLSPELLAKMNAYWRAANYLSVGQIYLKDNPLLERPLTLDDVKPRLLGHWGTTPGLNFLYVHWNRLIRERGLNILYVIGPGHGGPGLVANTYLEGSYSEIYPHIEQNKDGIKRFFRNSAGRMGFRVTWRRRRRGRFTRAASWGTVFRTDSGRRSTIRT